MPSPAPVTLRQRVLRAGGWSLAGYGLSQTLRLFSSLVMTRLLVPEMFGVMAIATMVDGDPRLAVRHRADPEHRAKPARRRSRVPRYGLGRPDPPRRRLVAGNAPAEHCAVFRESARHASANSVYSSPVLPLVIAVSSFSTIISGFASTRMSTAYRSFDQKRLIEVELLGQVAGLVVMIAIGVMTRSIWALVAGGPVASLTITVLSHSWMSGHANRLRWRRMPSRS